MAASNGGRRLPVRVDQRESLSGDYWYTIRGGNGENTATSKMYATRGRAKRAARAMIVAIQPAPVVFTHWTGQSYAAEVAQDSLGAPARGPQRHQITERINC